MGNPEQNSDSKADVWHSPFYEWMDNATIRDLVHKALELAAGERLVLIKGLVPGLVRDVGIVEFEGFLSELATKARRFQEAMDHPGEGRASRVTPGEELGGPTPSGHDHLATTRNPNQRGAREAERVIEAALWEHGQRSMDAQKDS